MRTVLGKEIPTILEEKVAPKHVALLAIDLQNDFLSEGGYCHRSGHDISQGKAVIASNVQLIKAARRAGVRVIYTRFAQRRDGSLYSPAVLAKHLEAAKSQPPEYCVEGTWGYHLVGQLKPGSTELVTDKARGSAFIGTNLEQVLRSNGVQALVITGVAAGSCVESTVRDALQRDFFVVVPQDCVGDCQPRRFRDAVRTFGRLLLRGDLTSSGEIIAVWAGSAARVGSHQ